MQAVLLWGSAFPFLSAIGTSARPTPPADLNPSAPVVATTAVSAIQQPAAKPAPAGYAGSETCSACHSDRATPPSRRRAARRFQSRRGRCRSKHGRWSTEHVSGWGIFCGAGTFLRNAQVVPGRFTAVSCGRSPARNTINQDARQRACAQRASRPGAANELQVRRAKKPQ